MQVSTLTLAVKVHLPKDLANLVIAQKTNGAWEGLETLDKLPDGVLLLACQIKIDEAEALANYSEIDPYKAAIKFAASSGLTGLHWLKFWERGEFDVCRESWPEAPEECYIGIDPAHPTTQLLLSLTL